MPVTPFHLGPALLVKAATPRYFSMVAFGVSQIVIDSETVYHVFGDGWPIHRDLHTLPAAIVVGLVSSLAIVVARRAFRKPPETLIAGIPGELGLMPCLIGGLFGGGSHIILDATMHSDVVPFAPMAGGNPLQGAVSLLSLHLLCLLSGVVGVLWLLRLKAVGEDHKDW